MRDREQRMQAVIIRFLLLLLLMQTTMSAQHPENSRKKFTLTLSQGLRRGEFPKGTQTLIVRLTNTSDTWIREDNCESGGALYKLDIVYNGVRQKEPDWIRKRREASEAGEGKGDPCFVSNPGRHIGPGEYWEDRLSYLPDKPGKYEFTVELTLPQTLLNATMTGKSNTLTIVVPQTEN